MSYAIELPDELAKQFFAEVPEQERENTMIELISDYLDKRKRQQRREELLKNPSPFVAKYAGSISEDYLRSLNDERINYLLDK